MKIVTVENLSPPQVPTDARLGHAGGEVAAEEGGLGGVEDQRPDVLGRLDVRVDVVDDREVHVLVLLGGRLGRVAELESDGDDRLAVLADHRVDVLGVVGVGVGLDLRLGDPHLRHGVLQALVRGLVERLVVEATAVGHHAGLGSLAPGRVIARCRRLGRRGGCRRRRAGLPLSAWWACSRTPRWRFPARQRPRRRTRTSSQGLQGRRNDDGAHYRAEMLWSWDGRARGSSPTLS